MADAKLSIVLSLVDDASKRLDGVSKQLQTLGKTATIMGGAITGAFALSIRSFVTAGDEVQKMAVRTGWSTEALSELKYAADLSGTSLATLETSMRMSSRAVEQARDGLEQYTRAFDKLGISVEDLEGLSPEEQFWAMASALAGIDDQASQTSIAMDLFGRAGTALLPMLKDGAEGIEAMREEARDLGLVFDQEAADKAAFFQDQITQLSGSFKGLMFIVASAVIPELSKLVDIITAVATRVKDWADRNPALVSTLAKVTLALGAFLLVAGSLTLALPLLSGALAAFGTALHLALGPLGLVTMALTALGAAVLWASGTFDKFGPSSKTIMEELGYGAEAAKKRTEELAQKVKEETEEIIKLEKDIRQAHLEGYRDQRQRLEQTHQVTMSKIADQYGAYEKLNRTKKDLARQAYNDQVAAMEREAERMRQLHQERLSNLSEEYQAKFRVLDLETEGALSAIQSEIDALDRQTQKEEKARRKQADARRREELVSAVALADTEEEHLRAIERLQDFDSDALHSAAIEERNSRKTQLYERMADIRQQAEDRRQALQDELKAKEDAEKEAHQNFLVVLAAGKEALDADLEEKLTRIEKEREAAEKAEKAKYLDLLLRLSLEEDAIKAQHDRLLTEEERYQLQLDHIRARTAAGVTPAIIGTSALPLSVPGFQHGGIVTRPTLAMLGERGPEAVVPLRRGGIVNINFNAPVYGLDDFERAVTRAIRDAALAGGFHGVRIG